MTPPISMEAGDPASRLSAFQPTRKGGFAPFRKSGFAALLLSVTALGGCAHKFIPPDINYDTAVPAKLTVDPPAPVKIVELPKPLPLPGQLKPLAGGKEPPQSPDPEVRVNRANAAARVQPVRDGFINAVQVYPYSAGALYQAYTAPGEITDIALQEGEQLVGSGPVAAGDTVRWIVGDTESGAGPTKRIHILVKPTRPDLVTNHHQHRPPNLPARIPFDRKDLHGVGFLAVPGRPAHRAAPAKRDCGSVGADRHGRRSRLDQFPLCDRG